MVVRVKNRRTTHQGDEAEKTKASSLPAQLQSSHPLLPRIAQGARKEKGREGHPPGLPAAAGGPRTASCEGCFLSCGHVLPTLPGGWSPQSAMQERGPSTSQVTFSNLLGPEPPGLPLKAAQRAPVSSRVSVEGWRVALPPGSRDSWEVSCPQDTHPGCCPSSVPLCDPRGSPSLPQGTTDPHLLLWQMAGRRSSQEPTQSQGETSLLQRAVCAQPATDTHTHTYTHTYTVRTSIIPAKAWSSLLSEPCLCGQIVSPF